MKVKTSRRRRSLAGRMELLVEVAVVVAVVVSCHRRPRIAWSPRIAVNEVAAAPEEGTVD